MCDRAAPIGPGLDGGGLGKPRACGIRKLRPRTWQRHSGDVGTRLRATTLPASQASTRAIPAGMMVGHRSRRADWGTPKTIRATSRQP